jgi:hypothetical protein
MACYRKHFGEKTQQIVKINVVENDFVAFLYYLRVFTFLDLSPWQAVVYSVLFQRISSIYNIT